METVPHQLWFSIALKFSNPFSDDPKEEEERKDTFCSWYFGIRETGVAPTEHNLCYSDMREMEIYRSSGAEVEVFITGVSDMDSLPPFFIQYKGKNNQAFCSRVLVRTTVCH